MAEALYGYNIFCQNENAWILVPGYFSEDPTECPNNPTHTVVTAVRNGNDITSEINKIFIIPTPSNNNNYVSQNLLNVWKSLPGFWYDGSEAVGTIKRVIVNGGVDSGSATGQFQLYIDGTITIICDIEWNTGDSSNPAKAETTTINNLPTDGAMLAMRFRRSTGLLQNVYIQSIIIYI